MLMDYLRRQKKLLAMLAAFAAVFSATAFLYGVPAEPVLYGAMLALFVGGGLFCLGFSAYRRRCRAVEQLLNEQGMELPGLPEPADRLEDDYQRLAKRLCTDRAALTAQLQDDRRDMLDYYTLWAHQIKTPLAAMELLLQEPEPDSQLLSAELLKVEQYVEMVLSYLRLDSDSTDLVLRRQPLDEIVHGAVRKYARLFILKKITLECPETGLTVLTDEKWLAFVLEQLLSNALKYTPAGGCIRIYAEDTTLIVADSGIGIQAEDLPRVFEKGFTGYNGRADKKATGLGLYLCRRICGLMGCRISIHSAPGQGTSVRLQFEKDRSPLYE